MIPARVYLKISNSELSLGIYLVVEETMAGIRVDAWHYTNCVKSAIILCQASTLQVW